MTELQWGIPIEGGETAPDGLPVWLYKVSADGTRRIEPHVDGFRAAEHWTNGRLWPYGRADACRICWAIFPHMNRAGAPVTGVYLKSETRRLTPEEGEHLACLRPLR